MVRALCMSQQLDLPANLALSAATVFVNISKQRVLPRNCSGTILQRGPHSILEAGTSDRVPVPFVLEGQRYMLPLCPDSPYVMMVEDQDPDDIDEAFELSSEGQGRVDNLSPTSMMLVQASRESTRLVLRTVNDAWKCKVAAIGPASEQCDALLAAQRELVADVMGASNLVERIICCSETAQWFARLATVCSVKLAIGQREVPQQVSSAPSHPHRTAGSGENASLTAPVRGVQPLLSEEDAQIMSFSPGD